MDIDHDSERQNAWYNILYICLSGQFFKEAISVSPFEELELSTPRSNDCSMPSFSVLKDANCPNRLGTESVGLQA